MKLRLFGAVEVYVNTDIDAGSQVGGDCGLEEVAKPQGRSLICKPLPCENVATANMQANYVDSWVHQDSTKDPILA